MCFYTKENLHISIYLHVQDVEQKGEGAGKIYES